MIEKIKICDYCGKEYMPSVCRKCKKKKDCEITINDGKMPCKDWRAWLHNHWSAIQKSVKERKK